MRDKSEGESDWMVEDGEAEYEFGSSPTSIPLLSIPSGEEAHWKWSRLGLYNTEVTYGGHDMCLFDP